MFHIGITWFRGKFSNPNLRGKGSNRPTVLCISFLWSNFKALKIPALIDTVANL